MLALSFSDLYAAYDRFVKHLFEDPLAIFLIGISLLILFFWYFATEIERRKRNIGTALMIGITGLCLMAATPVKERLKGGIDIVGGSAFSLRIQPKEGENGELLPITREQVDQAITVIEKRLNNTGAAEVLIAQQGDDGILVQMPGVTPEESEVIRGRLEKVAKLELRKVSDRSEEPGPDGKTLAHRVYYDGELVVGQRAFLLKQTDDDGKETERPILLSRRAALGGSDIANAVPSMDRADGVSVTLNDDGTNKMIALTQNMTPGQDRIAIVLDGEAISAPVVQSTPLGKRFEITGLNDPGEPKELANQLMNPLENPLVVEEMRNISPTLGKAVVDQGVQAGALAVILVYLFMLVYYRFSGVIAAITLSVCGVMLFGIMAMFGFTFSLPSIAGMVLTIGMAVDANVLIYERLREEMAAGKDLRTAINAAYEKAFSAIFDSNITSLITAAILFVLGSGAIKGFAITLIVGLSASMFAAIMGTRVIYRWGMDYKFIKKLSFMNLITATKFDFIGKRKGYAILGSLMVILAIAGIAVKGERCLGIDFTGGTKITFVLGEKPQIPIDEINQSISQLTLKKGAYPQEEFSPASGSLLTVRCGTEDAKQIVTQLRESFPVLAELDAPSTEEVSSVIGGTFMKQSIIALIFGLVGIMLYMTARFEFSFALGGFVAMIHDIIIAVGAVVLLGQELSLIHVGAVLTIAGYSINDTIIVFDRIRETLLVRTGSILSIMNEAINATLSRTLITSGTTLLTVIILSILGGSALRDFGLIILIGIGIGTLSSIFVASPIVYWWSKRKGRSIRDEVLATTARAESAASAP